jgi:hypothetical protein
VKIEVKKEIQSSREYDTENESTKAPLLQRRCRRNPSEPLSQEDELLARCMASRRQYSRLSVDREEN